MGQTAKSDIRLFLPAGGIWIGAVVVLQAPAPTHVIVVGITCVSLGAVLVNWWCKGRRRHARWGTYSADRSAGTEETTTVSAHVVATLLLAVVIGALLCGQIAALHHRVDKEAGKIFRQCAHASTHMASHQGSVGGQGIQGHAQVTGKVSVGVGKLRTWRAEATIGNERVSLNGYGGVPWRIFDVILITGKCKDRYNQDLSEGSGASHFSTQLIEISVESAQLVDRPAGWKALSHKVKDAMVWAMRGLDPQIAGLIIGMATGDTSLLAKETKDAFKVVSLSHLTAISGLHVAIALGAILRLIPRSPTLRIGTTFTILMLLNLIVGPTPSLSRAGVMAMVASVAHSLGRSGAALAALSVTIAAMVLYDPSVSVSIGFALSVIATYAVIGPVQRIDKYLKKWGSSRGVFVISGAWFLRLCLTPALCTIFTLPVILGLRNTLPVWAVAANVAALPAVAPTTIFALLIAMTSVMMPQLAHILVQIAQPFAQWIVRVAQTFAQLPGNSIPAGPYFRGAIVLLIVAAGMIYLMRITSPTSGVQID